MKSTTFRAACLALGLAAAMLAPSAAAQSTVAQLKGLAGNVLVSRDTGMVTGAEALKLVDGTRIITTANSEVVVEFDNGCRVHMKENQRLDVDSRKPCAALIPASLAAAPAVGSFANLAVGAVVGGAAAGGELIMGRGGVGTQVVIPVSPN